MKILVLNGPNLNLLGTREPDIYGSVTLDQIVTTLKMLSEKQGITLSSLQSNAEHVLVDAIQGATADGVDFILINPGALGHTSISIRDALVGVQIPFIEIHISNIYKREGFRHKSYLSDIAVGVIAGLGARGYELGLISAIGFLEETGK